MSEIKKCTAQLVETCRDRMIEHLAKGGTVVFGNYCGFSATTSSGLVDDCGCALTIAAAPLINKEDFGSDGFTNLATSFLVLRLGLSDIQRNSFAAGFDGIDVGDANVDADCDYYAAGKEVGEWYLDNLARRLLAPVLNKRPS